jgi:hypothetical protein
MISTRCLLLGAAAAALFGVVTVHSSPADAAVVCKAAGFATGCNFVITVNPNGLITGALGPSTTSNYDGGDDIIVGVENDCLDVGFLLTSLHLKGIGNGGGIFAFDGDGVCNGNYFVSGGLQAADCSNSTSYDGPTTHLIPTVNTNGAEGDVIFTTPLAPGQTTFFSLEGDAKTLTGLDLGTCNCANVPTPGSLSLFTASLAALRLTRRRKGIAA